MAAAHEGKTVKDFLIKLAQARIEELVRKGILQRAKGSDVFETTYTLLRSVPA